MGIPSFFSTTQYRNSFEKSSENGDFFRIFPQKAVVPKRGEAQ